MSKVALLLAACLVVLASTQSNDCLAYDQFGQGQDWSADWANWSFSNGQTNPTGDCSGHQMVGGLCNFGQGDTATGTFNNLTRHKKIRVVFKFYAVASWDSEWFYASMDGAVFHTQQSGWSNSNVGNLCGSSWADNFYDVDYTIAHSASDVSFYFRTTINQGACDEAMAFSDFKIYLLQENDLCVTEDVANQQVDNPETVCNLRNDFDNENWDDADFNNWSFTNVESNTGNDNARPSFVCDGFRMCGGYSYFGNGATAATQIDNIATHSYLRIAYLQHAVASWDNEVFYTELDGVVVQQQTYAWGNGVQVCGVGWNDNMNNVVDTIVAHTSSGASIRLYSSINQGSLDESMGFSDFVVEALDENQSCENSCQQTDYCATNAVDGSCLTDCDCDGMQYCSEWGYCQGESLNQEACYPEQTACNVHHAFKQGDFDAYYNWDGWYFSTGAAEPQAQCGDYQMMGGYGQFGQGDTAKFSKFNLPKHDQLRIRFKFYACASWDNETMYVDLDGVNIYTQTSAWGNSNVGNICGSSWADNFYDVDVTVDHNTQFMVMDWSSTINQGAADEAWGMSDFLIEALTNNECVTPDNFEDSCVVMRQFRQNAFTDADYLTWRFNQGANPPYYDCQGNAQMCGGGGNFGQGATGDLKIVGFPVHSFINIKMQFYAVASWDNETFYALLDGTEFYSQTAAWGNSNVGNLCGSSWADNFYDVDVTVAHDWDEMQLAFYSTINQGANDESWGFSDLEISYMNADGFCENFPACDHMCYYVDEWYNDEGSHQCSDDCGCDGQRTCVNGWCSGDARPADHGCTGIPDDVTDVVYDTDAECDVVTFYSECNYQGESLEIIDEVSCLEWEPKSICLPRGKAVRVNDLCDFAGQEAMFTTSISCINDIEFEMLAQFGITLKAKTENKLKTNSKISECSNQTTLF